MWSLHDRHTVEGLTNLVIWSQQNEVTASDNQSLMGWFWMITKLIGLLDIDGQVPCVCQQPPYSWQRTDSGQFWFYSKPSDSSEGDAEQKAHTAPLPEMETAEAAIQGKPQTGTRW